MPEYDFAATMREEVEQLRREIGAPDLRAGLSEMAQRFQVSEEEALAALWRASKRHGETLSVFVGELRGQFEREAAQAAGAAGVSDTASAASGAGAGNAAAGAASGAGA
ncbi:MAG TPA: hypothetical protein VH257_14925 [Chloroflexota bacterium]|nr:hypothetical protein [Chloroflexota bacterium]